MGIYYGLCHAKEPNPNPTEITFLTPAQQSFELSILVLVMIIVPLPYQSVKNKEINI
jgi:hypothetical protein